MTNAPPLRYVLITPARNEATFLEQTAMCVVRQTARPEKWVIVSDGSTDGTDEIAQRYAARYPWITLVQMPPRTERHFAGKVHAFRAGQQQLDGVTYDIIGNLDADLTFDDEYFAFLLEKFAANPRLGVAGTPFRDQGVAVRLPLLERRTRVGGLPAVQARVFRGHRRIRADETGRNRSRGRNHRADARLEDAHLSREALRPSPEDGIGTARQDQSHLSHRRAGLCARLPSALGSV